MTRVMFVSSAEMVDLQRTLECPHTFAEELDSLYTAFVSRTATALLPAFNFAVGKHIQELAFDIWGQLRSTCRAAGEAATVNELAMEFIKQVVPKIEGWSVSSLKTRCDASRCEQFLPSLLRVLGSGESMFR